MTNPNLLKKLYIEVYKDRLSPGKMSTKMCKLKSLSEQLFLMRLERCKDNISPEFSDEDLDKVLSKLKSGKARDPSGLAYELFKLEFIGKDLKESIRPVSYTHLTLPTKA